MNPRTHLVLSCTTITFPKFQQEYMYSFSGAVNLTHEEFTSNVAAVLIGGARCSGREDALTDCFYISRPGCGELDDAGVVCQSKNGEW